MLVIEAGESDQKQLMSKIPAGWVSRLGFTCRRANRADFGARPLRALTAGQPLEVSSLNQIGPSVRLLEFSLQNTCRMELRDRPARARRRAQPLPAPRCAVHSCEAIDPRRAGTDLCFKMYRQDAWWLLVYQVSFVALVARLGASSAHTFFPSQRCLLPALLALGLRRGKYFSSLLARGMSS